MRLSLFLLLLAASGWGQMTPGQMTPTPSQHRSLLAARQKLFTLQAKIANLQAEQVFRNAQALELCQAVIVDNRWPVDTACDLNSLTFFARPAAPVAAPPAAPAKAEEPKKEEPKKEEPKPAEPKPEQKKDEPPADKK